MAQFKDIAFRNSYDTETRTLVVKGLAINPRTNEQVTYSQEHTWDEEPSNETLDTYERRLSDNVRAYFAQEYGSPEPEAKKADTTTVLGTLFGREFSIGSAEDDTKDEPSLLLGRTEVKAEKEPDTLSFVKSKLEGPLTFGFAGGKKKFFLNIKKTD